MIVRATLVTDGSSDIVLLPILRWLVAGLTFTPVEVNWSDLRMLREPPRDLADRLRVAMELQPCDLLFVHRDAEGQEPGRRHVEIREANGTGRRHVSVVPVRMQEAWLLHDEAALREAAGRPSGTNPLNLPPAAKWEGLSDPKAILHSALTAASGASGRHLKRFRPAKAAHRLAELIQDWSPLRTLPAFLRLEHDTKHALRELGVPLRD